MRPALLFLLASTARATLHDTPTALEPLTGRPPQHAQFAGSLQVPPFESAGLAHVDVANNLDLPVDASLLGAALANSIARGKSEDVVFDAGLVRMATGERRWSETFVRRRQLEGHTDGPRDTWAAINRLIDETRTEMPSAILRRLLATTMGPVASGAER